MSRPLRICLVGASGLVGSALVRACTSRPDVRLVAVSRRELALPAGARLEVLIADPANWGDAIAAARPDALVSALGDKPLPAASVWFGEVSLAGEVRAVAHGSIRVREATKLGFTSAYAPPDTGGGGGSTAGIACHTIAMLPRLVDRILGDT